MDLYHQDCVCKEWKGVVKDKHHSYVKKKKIIITAFFMVFRIVKATLEDEDDFFIPFDPPLVSKFGPISRLARTKGRNTDPVQVTAEEVRFCLCHVMFCLQCLNVC